MTSRQKRMALVSCFVVALLVLGFLLVLEEVIKPAILAYWLISEDLHFLPKDSVMGLYDSAGGHVLEDDGEETITILCGVDEGPHCYYDWTQVNPDVPREISRAIVDGISPKEIDRTPDNIAYGRCRRPQSTPEQIQCEVKLWSEWYPIPVE